ncbi:hypothetical protein K503DRAFT_860574, partial [Rhizopogon vinicolor AM-OR11-026]
MLDVGFLATFFAEFRAYAVWENKLKVLTTVSIIAFMTPITICFKEMTSSVSGECWIPGVVGHLDTMASSRWTVVYSLLVVAEFEILLILVYRAVKSCGWRIENRLMRDLVRHNLLYFCCGFVFSTCVILTMRFLPRCRSYFVANTYVGFMAMFAAECIFIVRAYAVWEKKLKTFTAISIIAYMTPITICFQQMTSSVSGECRIPGVIEHLGTMASSRWTAVYCLLVVAEFEILLLLVYRAVKSCGWRIENRLMRDLVQDNLLYFCCGFVFSFCVILSMKFLPFPVAHIVLEFQVIAQTIMVTRMHREFWKSDYSFC